MNNNPKNRTLSSSKRAASVQSWAAGIDKIIRIDKQPPEVIESVIRWCQSDEFWKSNIMSGSKLREKWDMLTAKMPPASLHQQSGPRKLQVAL